MFKLFAIGEQVKDENLHDALPRDASVSRQAFRKVTAGVRDAPRRAEKFHICGNGDLIRELGCPRAESSVKAGCA
jgi:hypothetical protein